MHTSLLLFLFANLLVIGTTLSINQRHNSKGISRRADSYIFPGPDSQTESSTSSSSNNNNNEKPTTFFANIDNINNPPAPTIPGESTPIFPFSCPLQASPKVVPGGSLQLQQACCKSSSSSAADQEGNTIPKGCSWFDDTKEVCMNEIYWRCCQSVSNGGSGCTTTIIKDTPPPTNLKVPDVVPGNPSWQNYLRQSFVTGWDDLWER